ncbi:MAG: RidA family protein [Candidatus Zixiibacteriota bacterium]
MMKEIINTKYAPAAIGPYSQAIKITGNTLLFLSGVIALDPETMEIVGESAEEQCKQVMESISRILEQAKADLSCLVKTTIYLTDLNDFDSVNKIYAAYFNANPPARATVEVSRLPKDVKVEIEAIALL